METKKPGRTGVRILATSRLVSVTGDAAARTALALELYHQTHSARWVALMFLVTSGLSGVLLPFAGNLADKFHRKKLMIASELAGAAVFTAMAFAKTPGAWVLLVAVSVVADTPFYSASAAAIPNLVEDADLSWANSLRTMTSMMGVVIGPALAGLIVAVSGASAVFAINAVSFVISAAIIATIRGRFSGENEGEKPERGGVLDGFRHIWADPYLRLLVSAWTLWYFTVNISYVADVTLAARFGVGSFGYSMFLTSWGIGAVIGSFVGRRISKGKEPGAVLLGAAVVAAVYLAIGGFATFPLVIGGLLVAALFDLRAGVAYNTLLQRGSPDQVRARVFASQDSLGQAANVAAFVFAGAFAAALGPKGLYMAGGLICTVAVVILVIANRKTPKAPDLGGVP